MCRFAFGAAKGVAGWAFNQAVGAIAEGGTRQAGQDAKSRDIAAMYEGPQTISIGDLFSSGGSAPYGSRCPPHLGAFAWIWQILLHASCTGYGLCAIS
jgi:hypothetical protein